MDLNRSESSPYAAGLRHRGGTHNLDCLAPWRPQPRVCRKSSRNPALDISGFCNRLWCANKQAISFCPITSTAVSQIEGKQVKPIAILSKGRTPILPNLATVHEQGLADFDAYIWNGLFLPKDTPDTIAKKLHDATVGAMNTPAVQERIREMGGAVVAPERRSPEYLQRFVQDEIKKWAAPINASGISID
jgi:hypothetical protein